jgi:hypothetical protein
MKINFSKALIRSELKMIESPSEITTARRNKLMLTIFCLSEIRRIPAKSNSTTPKNRALFIFEKTYGKAQFNTRIEAKLYTSKLLKKANR